MLHASFFNLYYPREEGVDVFSMVAKRNRSVLSRSAQVSKV